MTKKSLNFTHSYYIFPTMDTYFCFVARVDTSEDKLYGFYGDLKRDLTTVCRGNLQNL